MYFSNHSLTVISLLCIGPYLFVLPIIQIARTKYQIFIIKSHSLLVLYLHTSYLSDFLWP